MEVKGFQFNLKELWELNLTTRRWTKSQMKGEIPEQLVSVVKYYKILRSCQVLKNIAKSNIELATLRHHTQQSPTLATLE